MIVQPNDNLKIKTGDEICVVRFKCNLETLSQIFDVVRALDNNQKEIDSAHTVLFFRYSGQDRDITTVYNENRKSTKHFQKNERYITRAEKDAFINANINNKIIIWEPIFLSRRSEKTDVVNFQYFMLILNYLEKCKYRHCVCISAGKADNNIYSCINFADEWSRLRVFLYLCSEEELSKIYIFGKYQSQQPRWMRVKAEDDYSYDIPNVGKIFPLVSINPNVYNALTHTKCGQEVSDETRRFNGLYNIYKSKALDNFVDESWFNKFKNDSLLEGLIFVATLAYIGKESLTNLNAEKFIRLHETCVDYAQGVAQLIENIVFHVINNDNSSDGECGCGSFTFRIREASEADYLVKEKDGIKFSYFMEIYVADINYNEFNGFVNKFLQNVNNFENNIFEQVNSTNKWNLTSDNVKLPHLFGEGLDKNSPMTAFFMDGENIAMHYGLQILNSVVIAGDGSLYVTSAPQDDKIATGVNSFFNTLVENEYNKPNFIWKNGTAYILYLPIKMDMVDYGDTIAISNKTCRRESINYKKLNIPPMTFESYNPTPDSKNRLVESIKDVLARQISQKYSYYLFDFASIFSNDIYAYEVLSKAIFLLLSQDKLKNIALVNIRNEYEVIKVFRQFSLFYDRFGENQIMADKSLFLIDVDGALDLLLYGTNLSSIKDNLLLGKIFGGYSEEALAVISHLCKRAQKRVSGRQEA